MATASCKPVKEKATDGRCAGSTRRTRIAARAINQTARRNMSTMQARARRLVRSGRSETASWINRWLRRNGWRNFQPVRTLARLGIDCHGRRIRNICPAARLMPSQNAVRPWRREDSQLPSRNQSCTIPALVAISLNALRRRAASPSRHSGPSSPGEISCCRGWRCHRSRQRNRPSPE